MIKVWDVPVRVIHWALVVLICFSWWTNPEHMDWHQISGLGVIALLVFRIIWGFVGSTTARFTTFLTGPAKLLDYLRRLPDRDQVDPLGHNPAGGWSVLAMLLLLTGQVVSGIFAVDVDGIESGPLSYLVDFEAGRWAADMHALCFTFLQGLIAVHILAVVFYLVFKRSNLIHPMITGRKQSTLNGAALRFSSSVRILTVASIAIGVAWAISKGLRLN